MLRKWIVALPQKTLDLMAGGIWNITLGALLLLAVWMSWEVFMRYAVHHPLDWCNEVFLAVTLYIAFVAAGVTLREKRHIALDVVYVHLKGRWRYTADMISTLATLAGSSAFFVLTTNQVIWLYLQGCGSETSIAFPDWILSLALSLGMLTVAIFALERLVNLIRQRAIELGYISIGG